MAESDVERLNALASLRDAFLDAERSCLRVDPTEVRMPAEKWSALVFEIHKLFGLEAILTKLRS